MNSVFGKLSKGLVAVAVSLVSYTAFALGPYVSIPAGSHKFTPGTPGNPPTFITAGGGGIISVAPGGTIPAGVYIRFPMGDEYCYEPMWDGGANDGILICIDESGFTVVADFNATSMPLPANSNPAANITQSGTTGPNP